MELWIRSQDRRVLVKVDNIFLNANYENKMICCNDNGETVDLGHYETKERALEVLDEIQEKLMIRKVNETSGIEYILCQDLVPIIYEMPKE